MSTETTQSRMTTIKVPVSLRQRIAGDAAEQGVSAAAFLTALLDRHERDRRFAEVRRAYAEDGHDAEDAQLTESWDRASEADLDHGEDE